MYQYSKRYNLFHITHSVILILFMTLLNAQDCTAEDGTPGIELWRKCYSIENTIELDLNDKKLKGSIPSKISKLTNLTILS